MQSQAFNKTSTWVLSVGNREGLSGKIIICAAFFTPLGTVFISLLQAIIGPGIFIFFQFLLMAVISKKNLSKMSTHPTFELRQDDTSDEGKKTKHNVE